MELARDPAAKGQRVQHDRLLSEYAQLGLQQDRVRLPRERRPEQALVDRGSQPPEGDAPQQWPRSDRSEDLNPAPLGQALQRPDRQLLQAQHVGAVLGGEADHLLEVAVPLRRARVAVEDVPGADEQAQGAG